MAAEVLFDHSAAGEAVATPAQSERSLAWTTGVIVVITALLALFSAASMKSWAETLPPTPVNAVIRQSAEDWFATTERLGLAAPRAWLHDQWQAARAAKFGGGAGADQR
jgi:hypothetical protein